MSEELTKEFNTPKEIIRALEEQERIAAMDRIIYHTSNVENDMEAAIKQQKLVAYE